MQEKDNASHFCLLIPCYNNREGLLQSLASVRYDGGPFRVVVVDDGSRQPLRQNDLNPPRGAHLHLITLPANGGITAALNAGLAWILQHTSIPFIARLDCGDTCQPARFDDQIAFLRAQPMIGLVGSWCDFRFPGGEGSFTYKSPLSDTAIRRAMHLRNVFIHPTVIFRTDVLEKTGLYPETFPGAEDYALFWNMLGVTQAAIIGETLVTCALSATGISAANRSLQLKSCAAVIRHFGTNALLKQAGLLQTALRGAVPRRMIEQAKMLINSLERRDKQ